MIVFENIETGHTLGIKFEDEGFHEAKLSAAINSSNLSVNADRGQDYGWRLAPEQQAILEEWEEDIEMVEKVSRHCDVMIDDLTHAHFLSYMAYLEYRGVSQEKMGKGGRREAQSDYEARVAALREAKNAEPVAAFDPEKLKTEDEALESFMSGEMTGDGGGDKVMDESTELDLAEVEKIEVPKDKNIVIQSTPAKKTAKK